MKPFLIAVIQNFLVFIDRITKKKPGFLSRVQESDSNRPSERSSLKVNMLALLNLFYRSWFFSRHWCSLLEAKSGIQVCTTHVPKVTLLGQRVRRKCHYKEENTSKNSWTTKIDQVLKPIRGSQHMRSTSKSWNTRITWDQRLSFRFADLEIFLTVEIQTWVSKTRIQKSQDTEVARHAFNS